MAAKGSTPKPANNDLDVKEFSLDGSSHNVRFTIAGDKLIMTVDLDDDAVVLSARGISRMLAKCKGTLPDGETINLQIYSLTEEAKELRNFAYKNGKRMADVQGMDIFDLRNFKEGRASK